MNKIHTGSLIVFSIHINLIQFCNNLDLSNCKHAHMIQKCGNIRELNSQISLIPFFFPKNIYLLFLHVYPIISVNILYWNQT